VARQAKGLTNTNPLRNLIFWLSTKRNVTDWVARLGARHGFARRFVAGETLEQALKTLAPFAHTQRRVILNHLGENVTTPEQARAACDTYIGMLHGLPNAGIDGNIAVKLTQLGLDFDRELCLSLSHEIASAAAAMKNTVEIDMESSSHTEPTLRIFEAIQETHGNAGIAVQAYLRRSESDLERLAPLKAKIRLVKGAYLEPASIAFQKKNEVDANYRRLLDRLLDQIAGSPDSPGPVVAIATHDFALVDYARAAVQRLRLPAVRYEFQMLFGIRRDLQHKVISEGHPFRVYVPFGEAWVPYFMRRLSERPANLFFVLRSLFAEGKN
jgi:proline dehydrogenase